MIDSPRAQPVPGMVKAPLRVPESMLSFAGDLIRPIHEQR